MQPTLEEQTPLLDESESGHCWACWESQSTTTNPLIRACRGCKDIDLQFIHQDCINSFISLLPAQDGYECGRCRDTYDVEERSLSPLVGIYNDFYLRFVSIMLVLGLGVMVSAFVVIMTSDQWGLLFEIWGFKVTVLHLAMVLTVVGMGAGVGLGMTIWNSTSGKKILFVKGIPSSHRNDDNV